MLHYPLVTIILPCNNQSYTQKLKTLRAQTGNGSFLREGSKATNKEIHKLENRVVMSRNKLSAAKTENAQLFHKINERRKDKSLMLRIYNEMVFYHSIKLYLYICFISLHSFILEGN
jgi:hypothetical protein